MNTLHSFKNTSVNSWIDRISNVWKTGFFPYAVITVSVTESWETPIVVDISEPYEILTVRVPVSFEESYGSPSVKSFSEPYYDVPEINVSFWEWYSDAVIPVKRWTMKYGDADSISTSFKLGWDVLHYIPKTITEDYSISQIEINKSFEEVYSLEVLNLIQKSVDIPYYMQDDSSAIYSSTASILVNGVEIDFFSVSISASTSSYCISCSVVLASVDEYTKCNYLDDVVVTLNGESFNFFIESKDRSITDRTASFTIGLLSSTAKLDSPYSDTIVDSLNDGANSKILVEQMAALQGITVDYQIYDKDGNILTWNIPGYSISISDETPLTVIKKVVNAVGAIVQTKPNGDMLIISQYPVAVNMLDVTTPDVLLSVDSDILSLSDSLDVRDGFNAFTITDQSSSSENITLEEENVDSVTKYIRGFRVPFYVDGDYNTFELLTSGNPVDETVVSIEKYNTPIDLMMPEDEDEEWEVIEFIDWTGSTFRPIQGSDEYPTGIIDWDWIEEDLGAFSVSEDGTLTIINQESVSSESLLRIKYNSKYWRWTVRGPVDIPIQFYVPEQEEL